MCNHSIQVWKSRRWITLCLWESQWIEKSRRLVPVGISSGSSSNAMDISHYRTGKPPLPLAMPMRPVGVTMEGFWVNFPTLNFKKPFEEFSHIVSFTGGHFVYIITHLAIWHWPLIMSSTVGWDDDDQR